MTEEDYRYIADVIFSGVLEDNDDPIDLLRTLFMQVPQVAGASLTSSLNPSDNKYIHSDAKIVVEVLTKIFDGKFKDEMLEFRNEISQSLASFVIHGVDYDMEKFGFADTGGINIIRLKACLPCR